MKLPEERMRWTEDQVEWQSEVLGRDGVTSARKNRRKRKNMFYKPHIANHVDFVSSNMITFVVLLSSGISKKSARERAKL
jgi:hypothetical protein